MEQFPMPTSRCPYTGLTVIQKPEWTDIAVSRNYRFSFSLIGQQIVLSEKSGFADTADTTAFFNKLRDILTERDPPDRPFIVIENYAEFKGALLSARRLYIKSMHELRPAGIVFYGLSPLLKLSIKLGRRFDRSRRLLIAKTYEEALHRALTILGKAPDSTPIAYPPHGDGPGSTADSEPKSRGTFPRSVSKPDWQVDFEDFHSTFEVILPDILHSVSSGYLKAEHVVGIEKLRERVRVEMGLSRGFSCIISGVAGVSRSSRRARKRFLTSLKHWHARYPFRTYIFYGVNRFVKTAFHLARHFVPFEGHIAHDLEDALRLAGSASAAQAGAVSGPPVKNPRQPDQHSKVLQPYVEELLAFLGSIDWERNGIDYQIEAEDVHPLKPVFDAITLIKSELEDLIAEREAALAAHKESETKYRTILDGIEEGYYEVDLAGNFTFFNDALLKLIGYGREELEGLNYRDVTDSNRTGMIFDTFHHVYQTRESGRLTDWIALKKDGSLGFFEISVSLIENSKGEATGFRGVARDLTDRMRIEKEKQRLEKKLQQAQKMEAIGMLAGGVAHDLNNILSGIVGYPDLLLLDIPRNSPLREPLVTIKRSGEKAATIVQDLLTLARRGVNVREVVNLNQIVDEYLQSPEFEKLIRYHPQVSLVTRFTDTPLNIRCSPVHISKTIMNLVSNAAEAMPEGGEISICTEIHSVKRPVSGYEELQPGEYAVVSVADAGLGISKVDRKRIFEPFYTKKAMGRSGTGLGMAVVWSTVKDHQGYIDLISNEGRGTTFRLYFPLAREEMPVKTEPEVIDSLKGNGESILVVDDVPEQRVVASRMLTRLGYSVCTVPSGEDAVEYLQQHSADLMILDMIMEPGIDGLETYRRVLEIQPGQKAVIVSGFSETDRVKNAMELGAASYLKKPYRMQEIAKTVHRALKSPLPALSGLN
jgi:PAS domain S-box-containing protein